ncbi:MAG: chemotaxis protein CheW [Gemmatimonadetes bacterium]|nr:chemotaxis protein CheW [Gemmatimonadota bacterium]
MSADEEIQLVTFRVGGQEFGFNILEVERILRYDPPAPLPQAPEFLEGMLEYGTGAIPVIDLRKRLNVAAPVQDQTRTMVLEWDQDRIGIVVDAVVELLRAPVDEITPPPRIVRGLAAKYIKGIFARDGRTVIILGVAKILASKERLELQQTLEAIQTDDS